MIRKHISFCNPSDTLLITGESNVGKSQFIQQMIVESICPVKFNGKGLSVIYLETRSNIQPHRILALLQNQIRKTGERMSEDDILKLSQKVLVDKLKIHRIYNLDQFNIFPLVLESILEVHRKTRFPTIFVLDCLATFYWSSCATVEQSRRLTYIRKIYDLYHNLCRRFNCPFVSSCRLEKGLEMDVNRMHLDVVKEGSQENRTIFNANVKQGKSEKILKYGINENGIHWM